MWYQIVDWSEIREHHAEPFFHTLEMMFLFFDILQFASEKKGIIFPTFSK